MVISVEYLTLKGRLNIKRFNFLSLYEDMLYAMSFAEILYC